MSNERRFITDQTLEAWVEEAKAAGYEDFFLYVAHQTGLARHQVKNYFFAELYGGMGVLFIGGDESSDLATWYKKNQQSRNFHDFYNEFLGIPYQPHRMRRMNSPQLENWSVTYSGNAYTAPECRVPMLQGDVYGHPDHEDGKFVRTSAIQEVQGRCVRTHNRWYNLGDPDGNYVDWCKENGHHVPTWDEPIKVKE